MNREVEARRERRPEGEIIAPEEIMVAMVEEEKAFTAVTDTEVMMGTMTIGGNEEEAGVEHHTEDKSTNNSNMYKINDNKQYFVNLIYNFYLDSISKNKMSRL